MGEKERSYPIKINEYYSPGLNSLKRVYTQHPKFNGNVRLIYELLFDYWNEDYGYAFPTIWQLSEDSGQGESTVKRCIQTLVELDLIEKRKSPIANAQNNIYIVKKPVTTVKELIAKFPEIEEAVNKRIAGIRASEAESKARLAKTKKKPDAENVEPEKVFDNVIVTPEVAVKQEETELDNWF